jgi:hypothetical protein
MLDGWDDVISKWCAQYRAKTESAEIVEIQLDATVFLSDLDLERVVDAHGRSTPALMRRELNRGWSVEGRLFRRVEQYVAAHPGVFVYHRPAYDDKTDIPDRLEYGVLTADRVWWLKQFHNKPPALGAAPTTSSSPDTAAPQ